MTLVFVTEARFTKSKNGEIYYENASNSYQLFENYFEVFEKVIVVARVITDLNFNEEEGFLSSGPKVSFLELPYFVGAKDYLLNYSKLKNALKKILPIQNAAYLCRVPGNIGHTTIKILRAANKPYGVEVAGDPWDVFSANSVKHSLRIAIQRLSYNRLRHDVKFANASLFVTEKYLQKRYKPSENSFTTAVSDVILNEEDYFPPSEREKINNRKFAILSVGSLEQLYKSPDILLQSLKKVLDQGYIVHLHWLGDGIYRTAMMEFAESLQISDHVTFHGNVGKATVKDFMRKADLFGLISQTEGLPRAMIEAMACSLPCFGSEVGGIPELIGNESLVPVNDPQKTSEIIIKFVTDSDFRKKQSQINFENAKKYNRKTLSLRRNVFLEYLKNCKA